MFYEGDDGSSLHMSLFFLLCWRREVCVLFILSRHPDETPFHSVGRNLIALQLIQSQFGFRTDYLYIVGVLTLDIRLCSFIGLFLAAVCDHPSLTPVKIYHYTDLMASLVPEEIAAE